jgi:Zn-finger nucleic acid-binding protein
VRLDSVRCTRCFSLQAPGAFACGRCGQSLELEALLDATDAPCPRCKRALESSPEESGRINECPRCGGIFVRREALAEILAAAEISGPMAAPTKPTAFTEVQYLPCPLCHASMNRTNFGKLSGVIVDVCKKHGTWFDAGELTRVVAFVASGGLRRTRARERDQQKEERVREAEAQRTLATIRTRHDVERDVREWGEILTDLFFW